MEGKALLKGIKVVISFRGCFGNTYQVLLKLYISIYLKEITGNIHNDPEGITTEFLKILKNWGITYETENHQNYVVENELKKITIY